MNPTNHTTIVRVLAARFKARAIQQGWKPKSATYQKHALEFFIGAATALEAAGGPDLNMICMLISVGRPLDELIQDAPKVPA